MDIPLGDGRPSWYIECTAMSLYHLESNSISMEEGMICDSLIMRRKFSRLNVTQVSILWLIIGCTMAS